MKILILGANGFIGSAIAARLSRDGNSILAAGRNVSAARARFPAIQWHGIDLARLTKDTDWAALLMGVDAVVNAAGALQDSARDDLAALQRDAMLALYRAAEKSSVRMLVQISANTADNTANTAFLATKKQADEALARSGLEHVIIRPALVVGRNAHGGTALLRALAAFPYAVPLAYPKAQIQTTDLDDLCDAVTRALAGELGTSADIAPASPESLSMAELSALHRAWLGLSAAHVIAVPPAIATVAAWLADLAGLLGWRSPMRSTAVRVLRDGVTAATGSAPWPTRTAEQTLADNPAGVQDLWFARMYLLKPLIMIVLAAFWIASGLIALISHDESTAMMVEAGFASRLAPFLVAATAALDCVLGVAVLWRPVSRTAMLAMIAISLAYLLVASFHVPALWLDPLGPLVKVVPAMALAVIGLAVIRER